MSDYFHHRGGTLSPDHPTYIERQADTDLFYALSGGEFCYVLNASQMGKSSLCNRIVSRLVAKGSICAFFDLKELDEIQDQREWYSMLVEELARILKVSYLLKGEQEDWLLRNNSLPPNILLKKFCTEILLSNLKQDRIVIFLDEIGTLLSKEFKNYFLTFIRTWHNARVQYPDFNRLVFCLLGIVAPSDLVTDSQYNFNIGQDIKLAGLEFHNTVESFSQGLKDKWTTVFNTNRLSYISRTHKKWYDQRRSVC
jgi:AAA-like domain